MPTTTTPLHHRLLTRLRVWERLLASYELERFDATGADARRALRRP